MNKKFGKIGVLAGGPSSEREISLRSGRAVYNAFVQQDLDAVFLDVWDDVAGPVRKNKIDVAFIALHGRFGEDGTVQQMLEEAGIPYTGSDARASRLGIDKIVSKKIFEKSGIPTPQYVVLEKDKFRPKDAHALGLPIVVKPQLEGSSIGLSIVREKPLLEQAIDKAFSYGDKVILEEYIDGRELTVGMLGEEPLPVIEIVTKNKVYDYMAKYEDPETKYLVPAPMEKAAFQKAQALARCAHAALGCRSFSRIDMMMDKSGNIFVLEVNTIPGMTVRSLLPKAAQATGLTFNKLCIKLIEDALRYGEAWRNSLDPKK